MHKRRDCLIAACVQVFATLFALSIISYSEQSVENDEREWDLQTKTAADYTLRIDMKLPVPRMKEEMAFQ